MRVGFVTIGQSPRVDVLAPFRPLLPGVAMIEAGALDDLGADEIAAIGPTADEASAPGASLLITRLRDGSHVTLCKERLLPYLETAINGLFARGLRLVVLLCTAEFPALALPGLLAPAQAVLRGTVDAVLPRGRLGVLVPLPEQAVGSRARFAAPGREVAVRAASPYAANAREQAEAAGRDLAAWRPDLIVLDCLGYSEEARAAVARAVDCPVIRPASLIARYVGELSEADAARG